MTAQKKSKHVIAAALISVLLAGCGGGGGGDGGGTVPPPPPAATFTLELTAMTIDDTRTGAAVVATGLPVSGATASK